MTRSKRALRDRIHPDAVGLYDTIVREYYPETLVAPGREGTEWLERWQRRREDERKFRLFMGILAQEHEVDGAQPNRWGHWPEEVVVAATMSADLRTAGWQRIRDRRSDPARFTRLERALFQPGRRADHP